MVWSKKSMTLFVIPIAQNVAIIYRMLLNSAVEFTVKPYPHWGSKSPGIHNSWINTWLDPHLLCQDRAGVQLRDVGWRHEVSTEPWGEDQAAHVESRGC